jgi:hypothetical protein
MKRVTFFAIVVLVFLSVPALAQNCYRNPIGCAMRNNMRIIGGGWGYGYGGYGRGSSVANGIMRVIETAIIVNGQVRTAQILAGSQPVTYVQQPVVYQQVPQSSDRPNGGQCPPNVYGLDCMGSMPTADVSVRALAAKTPIFSKIDRMQRPPTFKITNLAGHRARVSFDNGTVLNFNQGDSVDLTQGQLDAISDVNIFVTDDGRVVEMQAPLVPTKDFDDFNIVAPERRN